MIQYYIIKYVFIPSFPYWYKHVFIPELAVAIKGMSDMGYPVLKENMFEVLPAGDGYCVERSEWQLYKPDGKLGLRGM